MSGYRRPSKSEGLCCDARTRSFRSSWSRRSSRQARLLIHKNEGEGLFGSFGIGRARVNVGSEIGVGSDVGQQQDIPGSRIRECGVVFDIHAKRVEVGKIAGVKSGSQTNLPGVVEALSC